MKGKNLVGFLIVIVIAIVALGTCQQSVRPVRAEPISPGSTNLVACWDLDETSGVRYDYTDNNNDLADGNTVLYGSGISGNAADFEMDDNEYLNIADNAYLSMGDIDMTITGWVYLESNTQTQQIIWKYSSTGPSKEYMFYFDLATTTFRWAVSGDGNVASIVVASNFGAPSTATWYYFVLQHDATNNQIKISINNGTMNSLGHSTGIYDGNSDFSLSRNSSTVDFDGMLDTTTIYKRLLTADELTWLYNSGAGRSCASISPATPTPTETNTPTNTFTITETPTNTFTITKTPTNTFTVTDTPTDTFTPTFTETNTPTDTPTETFTPTITKTPTITNTPRYYLTLTYVAAVTEYSEIAKDNAPLVAVVASLCGILIVAALIVGTVYFTRRRRS